jgi:hypothetical protein
LLYGRAGFDSRLGTPMKIPLLSSSSENIGVGLNGLTERQDNRHLDRQTDKLYNMKTDTQTGKTADY